jgi:hypothetical protein
MHTFFVNSRSLIYVAAVPTDVIIITVIIIVVTAAATPTVSPVMLITDNRHGTN